MKFRELLPCVWPTETYSLGQTMHYLTCLVCSKWERRRNKQKAHEKTVRTLMDLLVQEHVCSSPACQYYIMPFEGLVVK